MNTSRFGGWTAALLIVAAAIPGRAAATERRPLPAFDVIASDGTGVSSAGLAIAGTSLMLMVETRCVPCDALLAAAAALADGTPTLASRIVVIVAGANVTALQAEALRYPALREARWFLDPRGEARARLQLEPPSAIVGLRGIIVEWTLTGALGDSADVRQALDSWLRRPAIVD